MRDYLTLLFGLLLSTQAFADGDLDPAFGTAGVARSGVAGAVGYVRGLAAQADGKIVTCDRGLTTPTASQDFLVQRFNVDGSIDATFGTGGRVFIDFGYFDICNAMAVQADGKLVLIGSTGDTSTDAVNFAVARLNTDGSVDTGFGTGGKYVQTFGSGTTASAVALAIQKSGAIVIAGFAASDAVVIQLLPNGTLDPSFGVGGQIISHFALSGGNVRASGVALDSLSRIIVVAGGSNSDGNEDFYATRLLASGEADMSFGIEGIERVAFDFGGSNADAPVAVAVEEGDKVVIAGTVDMSPTTSAQDEEYAVARLLENGTLDPGFGTQGRAAIAFAGGQNYVRGMAIQSNGLIVLAGGSLATSVATATRLLSDGSVDPNFGTRSYDLGATRSGFYSVIVSGVDIYAASFFPIDGGEDDAVVKLTNDQVFGNGF